MAIPLPMSGIDAFGQGFSGTNNALQKIFQHQLQKQQLMEAVKQHQQDYALRQQAAQRVAELHPYHLQLLKEQARAAHNSNDPQYLQNLIDQYRTGGNEPTNNKSEGFGAAYNPNNYPSENPQRSGQSFIPNIFGNPQGLVKGQIAAGNIDLNNRPQVPYRNGGVSTVYSMGIEQDGKHILIPQVSDDGRILTPEQAKQQFRQTGKHLGVFDSREASDRYAQQLHQDQAQTYPTRQADSQKGKIDWKAIARDPEAAAKFKRIGIDVSAAAKETPEEESQRKSSEHLTQIQQDYEAKKQQKAEEEVKYYADAAPKLQDNLDMWLHTLDLVKNNPDLFGHRNEEDYLNTTTNPAAGELVRQVLPGILETEKGLSKQGSQLALKVSKGKVPGVTDSQQSAIGKVIAALNETEKNRAQALMLGKVEGSTKGYRNGKRFNIPNNELLDFLKHGGHLYEIK